MLGVLLALIWQWQKGQELLYKYANAFQWSFIILFLVITYLTYQKAWIGDVFSHFWLALFYCNFIVLALIMGGKLGRLNMLKSRVLEWFGLRSYGIYLLHKPVQILMPFVLTWFFHNEFSSWTRVIIYLIVLVVISELSYRLLEKPIMTWGHRFKYAATENRQDELVQPRPA